MEVLPRLAAALDALEGAGGSITRRDACHAELELPLTTASALLGEHGFLRLPGRRGAFVTYDAASDLWLTVHVAGADGRRRPTPSPRGLSVALLAPDGAGKSTLAADLVSRSPVPAWTAHLGLYPRGERHLAVPGMRLAARVARQWRRYGAGRRRVARGWLVIFDRYPYDALLTPASPTRRLDRLRRRLLGRCLPAPDLVVILDAPGSVLAARKDERTVAELERQRQAYRALAKLLPAPVAVVDAGRSRDEVRRDLTDVVWRAYVHRRRRRER
ncbi:MAG TPA: hypothetical protein VKA57_05195 [Solirubrobacteraceae bacterium]|nr:hypothetical protein [Solirubrobacteraceae bacterium]